MSDTPNEGESRDLVSFLAEAILSKDESMREEVKDVFKAFSTDDPGFLTKLSMLQTSGELNVDEKLYLFVLIVGECKSEDVNFVKLRNALVAGTLNEDLIDEAFEGVGMEDEAKNFLVAALKKTVR